tara:strand:+ start:205 stop:564 length:360 start_codon:yes stop_codon:yes gene_type:complete
MKLPIAVPIHNVKSFYHIYLVDFRYCWCCYKSYFKIKKSEEFWVLKREGDEKSYTIPLNKNSNQICNILYTIGLQNKIMKMKLIQDNKIIKTKNFYNLNSLINSIIFTEKSLEGVMYVK